ncbi:DUF5691 domain-containing protein [Actinocorallia longicatena]|uniref:DUF5691 domain-containing protein n=1 Tax=Actinocorallia longicatena TaxID=111803 RepID=UPI0031DB09DB
MSVWAEHVTVALLGTRRRGVPDLQEALLPEADAAARLLDHAGLLAVQRRAGMKPGAAEAVAPAPAEEAPAVPGPAALRLEMILGGERGRMLPEWLGAAARGGYRVPARNLPELLDKGRSDRAIRPYIARAAGRRGAWLALQNPDWAYLLTESGASAEGVADWESGTRGQRVAALTALRRADPGAARARLLETWTTEAAPDRAAFLATFEHSLSAEDEEFLERCLDDRGKDVRQNAADLLARLPGSEYARRMAGRARGLLSLGRRTVRSRSEPWITVVLPADHDDAMARDGIPFHPAGSFAPSAGRVGARAAWLREILARAPLATWTETFGLPPGGIVALPVTGDLARDLHLGWARAALLQRDVAWARALLSGGIVVEETDLLGDLLRILPADERESVAADLIRWNDRQPDLLGVLSRIPGPWEGRLADAVLSALAAVLEGPGASRHLAQLCRLADERLTPAAAPRLTELAARHDTWPLSELAATLRFRHEMLLELAAPAADREDT